MCFWVQLPCPGAGAVRWGVSIAPTVPLPLPKGLSMNPQFHLPHFHGIQRYGVSLLYPPWGSMPPPMHYSQ